MINLVSETMEIKGERYYFSQFPLESYLANRPDIEFGDIKSYNKRGYEGYWKLEDSKIFLKSIKSSNHNLKSIFNTTFPVFASWYSGIIELGLGKTKLIKSSFEYEYYLWLKIENGKVIENEVIRRFDQDFLIEFGKYNGRTFFEVLYGKINRQHNTSQIIWDYLNEVVKFFCKAEFNKEIQLPVGFKFLPEIKRILNDVGYTSINFLLTDSFLALEKSTYLIDTIDDVDNLSILIENLLSTNFSFSSTLKRKITPQNSFNEKTLLINPDFRFLERSIFENSDFSFPPHYCYKGLSLKFISSFSINRLNSTIFEYTPKFEDKVFIMSEENCQLNIEKFQEKNGVIYDAKNDRYFLNRKRMEIFNQFSTFLDKKYFACGVEDDIELDDDNESQEFGPEFVADDKDRDYFDVMTDGQLGDYDDYLDNGGDIDEIDTWSRG